MGIVAFFDNTLNCKRQRYKQTSKIISSLLEYFTASAKYLRDLSQRYKQMSEKHEVYFNVFYSECSISSRFISKIQTNEQKT
jgi:hypothetical protein